MAYLKIKTLIFGSDDSGKKGLGEKYLKRFESSEQDEIGVELLSKDFNLPDETKVKVIYWNCTANKEFENIIRDYVTASKGALIWFNLGNPKSFKDVSYWINLVRSEIHSIPILLVGDLSEHRNITYDEARKFAEDENLTGYIEVSIKSGNNIMESLELFLEIILYLQKAQQRRAGRKDLNPSLRKALESLSTGVYPESIIHGNSTYAVKDNRLDLKNKNIQKIKDIFGLDKFVNITDLDLSENKIYKIKGLEMLVNLERLDLSKNKIIDIRGLSALKSLKTLILSKNLIENIKNLDHLPNLELLDLSSNMIREIKGLERLRNLKELRLNDNLLSQKLLNELGGLDEQGYAQNLTQIIDYSRKIHDAFENYALKGEKLLTERKYKLSIDALMKAIEIYHDDKEVWNNLGYNYYYLDEYEQALEAFKKALEIDKDYYYSLYNLGLIFFLKEDYLKAIKYYNKALDTDTSNLDAWYNLGLAYLQLNKFYKAIECFRVLITKGLADIDLWINIGQAYSNIKNFEEAYHSYLQVTKIDPQYQDIQKRIQLVKNMLIGKRLKTVDTLIQERKIAAAEEILRRLLKEAHYYNLYSLISIINEKLQLCAEIEELNKKIILAVRDREDLTFNQLFSEVEAKMEELKAIMGHFKLEEGYNLPKEKQSKLIPSPPVEFLPSEPKPASRRGQKS